MAQDELFHFDHIKDHFILKWNFEAHMDLSLLVYLDALYPCYRFEQNF